VGISIADQFRVMNNFIHHNRQCGFTRFRATGFLFQDRGRPQRSPWILEHLLRIGDTKLVQTTNVEVIGNYLTLTQATPA
jgi:hypothetical protein